MLRRQKYPTRQASSKRAKAGEARVIEQLRCKLGGNPWYQNLKTGQRNRLELTGMTMGWTAVARSAKLADANADHCYSFLCGYAHSDRASVRQIIRGDRQDAEESVGYGLEAISEEELEVVGAWKVYGRIQHDEILPDEPLDGDGGEER